MNLTHLAAIDFETATPQRSSACAVALAVPNTDGSIDTQSWLLQPPDNEYAGINIGIHGIHPSDTSNAPTLHDVWPQIDTLIADRILVAHNAAFDMSVLSSSYALHADALPRPYQYLCTLRLAQVVWPDRDSHKLADIAEDLGLDTTDHHNPLWDAWAAVQVAEALISACSVETLTGVAGLHGFGPLTLGAATPRYRSGRVKASSMVPDSVVDDNHPLCGQLVVITGSLPNGMSKRQAYQQVVNVGGRVADSVSRKVDILVADGIEARRDGSRRLSGKLKKATELAEQGHPIVLMEASEFLRLLG